MDTVTINAGSMVLTISDPRQVQELASLDTDRNGTVELSDLKQAEQCGWGTLDRSASAFNDGITNALANGGAFRSELQQHAFRQFLDLYPKIRTFDQVTSNWCALKAGTDGTELDFNSADWNSEVRPYITGDAVFTPKGISDLSRALYTTMFGLNDQQAPLSSYDLPTLHMGCGRVYIGLLAYSMAAVPTWLGPYLTSAIDGYSRSIEWLGQFSGLKCIGAVCQKPDEITIKDVAFLPPLPDSTKAPNAEQRDHRYIFQAMTIVTIAPFPVFGALLHVWCAPVRP